MTVLKEAEAIVAESVAPVARRFHRFVSNRDLQQQCWLWIVAHPTTADALFKKSRAFLIRRLRTTAERYARRQKAATLGYHPDDEYFYSLTRLEELLPDAFDPEATPPASHYEGGVTGERHFAEWETSLADARAGLRRIPLHHWAALNDQYGDGEGCPLEDTVRAALRALQRVLGGPRPEADNTEGEP